MVADGADILANRRSTRANTLVQLVGEVRWCVVARENMGFIESASERMRVSLTRAVLGQVIVSSQRRVWSMC